jgi:2'-5' RNA ligase
MAHHRLFVALRPPPPVREALRAVMHGVPGARWQDDEQLHCTLRFLGEVDRHTAEDIAAALGQLSHPAIDAQLDMPGWFDRAGRIEALWIGVGPRDPLRALHDKIGRLLRRAGVAADERAYLPHITIARFARSTAPTAEMVARIVPPIAAPFRFTDVRLYESVLGSTGAAYQTVARYPLDG